MHSRGLLTFTFLLGINCSRSRSFYPFSVTSGIWCLSSGTSLIPTESGSWPSTDILPEECSHRSSNCGQRTRCVVRNLAARCLHWAPLDGFRSAKTTQLLRGGDEGRGTRQPPTPPPSTKTVRKYCVGRRRPHGGLAPRGTERDPVGCPSERFADPPFRRSVCGPLCGVIYGSAL